MSSYASYDYTFNSDVMQVKPKLYRQRTISRDQLFSLLRQLGIQCDLTSFDSEVDNRPELDNRSILEDTLPIKYRQLPCRTFLSCGTCPYRDRCVFLHDPRIANSFPGKIKCRRKSMEEFGPSDSFFWPTMDRDEVNKWLDGRNAPTVSQFYVVPAPGDDDKLLDSPNVCAVYSMWMHFLDALEQLQQQSGSTQEQKIDNPYTRLNAHNNKPRLSVFTELSKGKSLSKLISSEIQIHDVSFWGLEN